MNLHPFVWLIVAYLGGNYILTDLTIRLMQRIIPPEVLTSDTRVKLVGHMTILAKNFILAPIMVVVFYLLDRHFNDGSMLGTTGLAIMAGIAGLVMLIAGTMVVRIYTHLMKGV